MGSVAASRLFLLMLALALGLGTGCTRAYIQNVGTYAFKATEVLRDDCGMLSSPDALWGGKLRIAGEVVYMDSELMDMQLVGAFLEGGADQDDAFSIDGSASNASVIANGSQCIVDQVTMHLEGTTLCATEFDGVLSVRYEPRIQQSECACELWVRYQAVQNGQTCGQ